MSKTHIEWTEHTLMTTFSSLYSKYFTKLEINKSYKLGDILNRLNSLNEDCDLFMLYLEFYCSDNFSVKIVSEKWEDILIKKIK